MAKKGTENLDADLGIDGLNDDFVAPGGEIHAAAAPAAKAQPKAKQKIRIMIDEVKGMSNYEVVGVNGQVTQIKRGVPVWVDPSVVHVLENAQTTHIEQKANKITGEVEDIERTFSAIPWRRM